MLKYFIFFLGRARIEEENNVPPPRDIPVIVIGRYFTVTEKSSSYNIDVMR